MPEFTCGQCIHYDRALDESGRGVCRRHPPTAVVVYNDDNGYNILATHPPVADASRACGDFRTPPGRQYVLAGGFFTRGDVHYTYLGT